MPEFLVKLQEKFKTYWDSLEKSQRNRIVTTSSIVMLVITVAIILLTRVNYINLMTVQDSSDLKGIQKDLTDNKIPHKHGEGGQILVNSRYKNEAEFALASAGLTTGGMNFTDAWNQIKISSTESDKKELWNNFKKTNLIAKLKMFDNVKDADVELAIPEKSEYFISKNEEKPTAYVRIKPKGDIEPEQVQAIARIVASAIIGLKPEDVTVVDNNLNLLSHEMGDTELDRSSSQYKMKLKVKSELEKSVKKLYPGNSDNFDLISVVANPVLDFNKLKTVKNEIQKPTDLDEAIISSQNTEENLVNATPNGAPGVDTNPGATTGTAPTYPINQSQSSTYDKKAETLNREFTKVLTEAEKSLGDIDFQDSSMTVILWYGQRVTDPNQISPAFITQIKTDVSSATGIPAAKISVNKYKLAAANIITETLEEKIKKIIDAYGLFALMLLFAVSLLIIAKPKKQPVLQEEQPALGETAAALTGPRFVVPEEELPELTLEESSEVKKQIDKLIKQKPEAVAQLLRNWLADDWE